MAARAEPAVLWDWGKAVLLRGDVMATSKAVCFPRQFERKMSPGRERELGAMRASFTGKRPANFADSKMASRIVS